MEQVEPASTNHRGGKRKAKSASSSKGRKRGRKAA
jgi:hypothetical protein